MLKRKEQQQQAAPRPTVPKGERGGEGKDHELHHQQLHQQQHSILDIMVRNKRKPYVGKSTLSSVSEKGGAYKKASSSGMNGGGASGATGAASGKCTLDMKHSDMMARFHDNKQRIEVIQRECEELRNVVHGFQQRGMPNLDDDEFAVFMNAQDRLRDNEKTVEHLSKSADEEQYLVSAGDILFKYYDVVENGTAAPASSSLPGCGPGPRVRGGSRRNAVDDDMASKKSILRFFRALDVENQKEDKEKNGIGSISNGDREDDDGNGVAKTAKAGEDGGEDDDDDEMMEYVSPEDRASLLDKYVACIEGDNVKSIASQMDRRKKQRCGGDEVGRCPHCGSSNRVILLQDGCVYCNNCLTQEYIMIDHDKPSYKDPPKEITYFAYKRINHFNEWLNQMQGKETTDIPDEIYDSILLEFKKQRMSNMADLTNKKIRAILRKLGLHTYYEHVAHIKFRLNGIPVPYIPPELEERLRDMFYQIQVPFLRHAPLARKNFLSYSYVLHKFMQLLDKDEYLDSFPLLKSRDKLHMQDQIWQKICGDLHWEFYKSI